MQSIASTATMVGIKSPHNITSLERYVPSYTIHPAGLSEYIALSLGVFYSRPGSISSKIFTKEGSLFTFQASGE